VSCLSERRKSSVSKSKEESDKNKDIVTIDSDEERTEEKYNDYEDFPPSTQRVKYEPSDDESK